MSVLTQRLEQDEEKLYRLFLRRTNDPQESRDLLQDLYESVLGNLDSFALVENQTAWLVRAALNKITDWYRKKGRCREFSYDGTDEEEMSFSELLADLECVEERTFKELSMEWAVPVGTLLSRKREAVRLLREALEDFSDVWYEMNND